jgi:hypothetical protein
MPRWTAALQCGVTLLLTQHPMVVTVLSEQAFHFILAL